MYVGASTGVPELHDGVAPVPPDTTAWPAVVGTHSQPGVTAAASDAHPRNTANTNTPTSPNLRI